MFLQLGRLSASRPWLVGLVWLTLGGITSLIAPSWESKTLDDDVRFIPDRFTSVRAYQLLQEAFPQEVFASKLVLAVERNESPLTDDDFKLVDQLILDLEAFKTANPELKLGKIDCYKDPLCGYRLVSRDQHCTLAQIALESPFLALSTMEVVERLNKVLQGRMQRANNPPSLYLTGSAGIGRDLTKACSNSLEATTIATVILVIVVLLSVYRAPLLALVPLATIAISVWVALNVLACATMIEGVHLVDITKIFAIVILYGAGTDYCLFLVSRYREELEAGRDTVDALSHSVGSVGEALAASAGTVMVGLGMMAFAEFAKVRYAGPAIAVSLGVALVASLTLTPALLRILGPKVFWPLKPPEPVKLHQEPAWSFWEWCSHLVVRRPVLIWSLSIAVLLPFVVLGLRVQPNYRATSELCPKSECLQGLACIQRHYTPGEIGPITVLLASDGEWDSQDGRLDIERLSRGLAHLPNVAEVRSLTQPIGAALPDLYPPESTESLIARLYATLQPLLAEIVEDVRAQAKHHYLSKAKPEQNGRWVTRVDVILKTDPFENTSVESLKLVQTYLNQFQRDQRYLNGTLQADIYGITSSEHDLAVITENDRTRVNMLVLGAIFLILLALVRKLWLACYLLVTVLASYFAALGATALLNWLVMGSSITLLDWRVPFFLFTILVAVGEDYNILLVSRALEEGKHWGPVEGMRRALAKTGGPITSCGLIMAGTFATLMLAGLGTLMQIGFALAFGVLIDTFIVRPFLVPAFAIFVWSASGKVVEEAPQVEDETPDIIEFRRAA